MKNLLKFTGFFTVCILLSILFFDNKYDISISERMFTENRSSNLKNELILVENDSSTIDDLDTTSVVIDNVYTRMVLNVFVDDAVAHGLDKNDVVKHIKALDVIIVRDMSDINAMDADSNQIELLGLTLAKLDPNSSGRIRGAIFINIKLLNDLDLYAFTLYHELGHWFGLEHCECDDRIMMDNQTDEDVALAYEKWDQSVRLFMKKIHEKYDNEKCHYAFPTITEDTP